MSIVDPKLAHLHPIFKCKGDGTGHGAWRKNIANFGLRISDLKKIKIQNSKFEIISMLLAVVCPPSSVI